MVSSVRSAGRNDRAPRGAWEGGSVRLCNLWSTAAWRHGIPPQKT